MRSLVRPSFRCRRLVIALAFVLAPLAVAADGSWEVDDIVLAERAGSWSLAADGRIAVWIRTSVGRVGGEEKSRAHLWLTDLTSGDSRPLIESDERVAAPRLSPDGRHVAFLWSRKPSGPGQDELASRQLWALPLGGGAPFAVTRSQRAISSYDWSGPEELVVAMAERPSRTALARKARKDTAVVVDDLDVAAPVRLFRWKLDGTGPGRITTDDDWIEELAVAPGGRHAVVTAQQSLSYEFDQKVPPHTYLVDLGSGERRRLLEGTGLLAGSLDWAPDGAGFYFVDRYTRHPQYREATIGHLWYHDLTSDRPERVELHWERGLGNGYVPIPGGVVALLADGVRDRAVRIDRAPGGSGAGGWRSRALEHPPGESLEAVEASRDGSTLVYRHSTAVTPTVWKRSTLRSARLVDVRPITELNTRYADKPTGRVEVVRWIGAEGDEVEGLLHYPLDWSEGRRAPLILDIHGGPAGRDRDAWSQSWAAPVVLWRQRGAFVFQINYHGSSGYGLDWVESIGEGRYYELEVPDIESGVDTLIERGLVDPERMATTGWSNGGILSAALITHTDRYRAAIVGAADIEWFSDWANVDFGAAFDNYYLGGTPWEIPDVYMEKSPFFRLAEVVTPTLVHTGTEDRNVPPHQSWSLFRVLQHVERAPARLVLYPGEPHSLRKPAHQRRKIREDLAWLDRHLFENPPEGEPAIPEDSPLAARLDRASAERGPDGALGVLVNGVLVPETVEHGSLLVGRFEVTRAQFQAFSPAIRVRPDRRDHPMTSVDLETARAYAAWLAERTGRPFRLPTLAEAKEIGGGDGGNTLDRWVGYTPSPEDRERILGALDGGELLRAVGTSADGRSELYDVDGNVAEWAIDDGGDGVAHGASADRSGEDLETVPPGPEYVGLRVVVDRP